MHDPLDSEDGRGTTAVAFVDIVVSSLLVGIKTRPQHVPPCVVVNGKPDMQAKVSGHREWQQVPHKYQEPPLAGGAINSGRRKPVGDGGAGGSARCASGGSNDARHVDFKWLMSNS